MRHLFGFLVLLLPVLAWGQQASVAQATVRTSGEAVVYAKPDRAIIEIKVLSQAATAQAAATQNAEKTQAVLTKLRAAMGSSGQVEGSGRSIDSMYHYPDDNNLPTLRGYRATSEVTVTTEDLNTVGKLIDAAASVGTVQVGGVRFIAKDVTDARSRAIREATRIARKYAEGLAAAEGVKLGEVLSLEGVTPAGWDRPSTLNSVAMPGPSESVAVRASVVLTVAIQGPAPKTP